MSFSVEAAPPPQRIVLDDEKEEEVNDNPIEQVRLTVPITDDPTQPVLTFRTWVLGILACAILSFVNQFFGYRQNQLFVGSVSAQIVVLPLGKLMAATLPTRKFRISPFWDYTWSLNPGPFNMKEHALITIFASCGSSGVYAVNIITIIKAFYKRGLHPGAAFLLAQTTQLLGYGWAGLFRKILVDSPFMWWPANLVQVSLFRALHEKEKRAKGGYTRLQFFTIVFICSFAYYAFPGYFMPSISTISVICLVWSRSITAQQVGSGMSGLGLASFGLDWATVASFLGSPIANPLYAIVNSFVGFVLLIYVVLPIAYWGNVHQAKRFPIFSSGTFDSTGHPYNITRILNDKSFDIDLAAYDGYSKIHLSIFFAFVYGLSFATLTATISHVALFDGQVIVDLFKKATAASKARFADVHTRIMKKNYDVVPQWWFILVLIVSFFMALYAVEGFGQQLQLPWWGLIFACVLAMVSTLPIGIIQATTNNQIGLNVITELMIGYAYPGKPLANVAFKTYGYISMAQALSFVEDFKLGHYMKIPPKSMFIVQLVGTLVASSVYFATAWWILESVPHVCDLDVLPEGSPWTCPGFDVFYSASIIWGVVSPRRMFGDLGIYREQYWFFLLGLLAPVPVWLLSRKFPNKKWIKLIHMPLILGASASMPPARPVHYWSWAAVGFFFNYYVYKRHKGWWARHAYILSAAMDAGVAFMGILLFFALQSKDIYGPDWWGLDASDHCTLAKCPTAPGVIVKGCPAIS
ncbi:unnamed protein product [Linum tenue]|uniref:Uncharacterized protein n=1 Tax=Linum tenue TaxID=586396 RepID=A0AAV0H0A0_9ROSI|nr:unnamed protein product [Linum tenue]